jgi:hypothetical protein
MNDIPHLISLLSMPVATAILNNESYSMEIIRDYGVTQFHVDCAVTVGTTRFPGIGGITILPTDRQIQISNERINSIVTIIQSLVALAPTNYKLRAREIECIMSKSKPNMINRYYELMKTNFSQQNPISESYISALLSQKYFIALKAIDTFCEQCIDGITCFTVHYTAFEERIKNLIGQVENTTEQSMFRDYA